MGLSVRGRVFRVLKTSWSNVVCAVYYLEFVLVSVRSVDRVDGRNLGRVTVCLAQSL